MKNLLFALAATLCACLISCQGGQKASPRVNVWAEDSDTTYVGEISVSGEHVKVPFKRLSNGLAEVQVSLNGVPFNMWWDTGASITCISFLELQKLAKEGKVALEDYEGNSVSSLADGSQVQDALFRIKEVYIQGMDNESLVLKDVLVSVSSNEDAPLLIGQNIISELPKHSFNDSNETIDFDKQ